MRSAWGLFVGGLGLCWAGLCGAEPWRLASAIGAPDELTLTGAYRLRYEYVDGRFRAGLSGSDQILVERLLLAAEYDFGHFYAGAELQDSRAQLADAGSPLGTDDVNSFELLRGYLGYRARGVFQAGDNLDLSAGRLTIDVGGRRLIARNGFRNTINAFTGLNALYAAPGGLELRAFYVIPVDRRPNDFPELLDNAIAPDVENPDLRFWAVQLGKQRLAGDVAGEIYVFGLQEQDRASLSSNDRNLFTPGVRLRRAPRPGGFDFQLEAAVQAGQSALSRAAEAPLLSHLAFFTHAQLGYTFEHPWRPRLNLEYDYASGDRDPQDGRNGRFDTLFGARRFEFGPTGIFGPLSRSNLNSPGVRLTLQPTPNLSLLLNHRAAFLAARRDALVAAGLRDETGQAGAFIGHQFEGSLRWDIAPGNVRLETGVAYLADGRFLREAPNASPDGDTFYGFSSVEFSF